MTAMDKQFALEGKPGRVKRLQRMPVRVLRQLVECSPRSAPIAAPEEYRAGVDEGETHVERPSRNGRFADRLSRDKFHPNEEGYRLIAERVKEAL